MPFRPCRKKQSLLIIYFSAFFVSRPFRPNGLFVLFFFVYILFADGMLNYCCELVFLLPFLSSCGKWSTTYCTRGGKIYCLIWMRNEPPLRITPFLSLYYYVHKPVFLNKLKRLLPTLKRKHWHPRSFKEVGCLNVYNVVNPRSKINFLVSVCHTERKLHKLCLFYCAVYWSKPLWKTSLISFPFS